ncbi:SusC/RagA family TonB-linked outer membrane protein [Rufibacter sp. XAAS-G3-1]|uniref:SusC/RagA family TonB-linked outer membrane protein n=1 Tax=Rufibacter sp. XAAS-G3-1 TaxID=2729134 RepID=UPI0015E75B43|nr:SusC/RagA family TonB-linked outer membrane protein [Rufibacter sp. XAAS-G3-1]
MKTFLQPSSQLRHSLSKGILLGSCLLFFGTEVLASSVEYVAYLQQTTQQAQVPVKGKVVDQTDGSAMPGVTVFVNDQAVGMTNVDGTFQVSAATGATLSFTFIGYQQQKLVITKPETNLTIRLAADATQINEVVVTALGITREQQALGYSTATIQGETLTEAMPNNWTDALTGRVAGLNMVKSGGGPTGSNRIILRGENDLGGSSEALIVVDGVIINGGSGRATGTGSTAYLQSDSPVDFGTNLNDINPEDIESVTVLKGPGATALYGSRGANGAVIITTKDGKPRVKGLGVSFNSNFSLETINRWPDYQNEYGQGDEGVNYYSYNNTLDGTSTRSTSSAWGARFDGQMFYQYDPATQTTGTERTPWVPYKDSRKDFFQTGKTLTNTVTLDGGTAKTAVRFSLTNVSNDWIIPNTGYKRNTVALSLNQNVTDKLKISSKINYTNKYSDNLPSTGYNNQSIMYWATLQVPNGNVDWYKDYWKPGQEGILQNYPYSSLIDNPYLIAYEMLNKSNRHSITGNIQATYDFTKELSLMVRTAMDFSYEQRSQRRPKDTEKYKEGMYREQNIFSQEMNYDFLLRYGRNLGDRFEVSASLGGSKTKNRYVKDELRAERLIFPQVYNFANSRDVLLNYPYRSDVEMNGIYGLATVGFDDWLFVDLTLRKDWSSTLASRGKDLPEIKPYPSVSVSTILSEVIPMPASISLLKLRGSWAEVGSGGMNPYYTTFAYEVATGFPSGLSNPSAIPNANLLPLRTESVEFGLDARFFKSRIGLDVAVYRNNTRDQILRVPIDRSSGANYQILNAGLVRNQGIEIQANGSPLKSKNGLNWNMFATYSANRNTVIELSDSLTTYQLQRGPGGRGSVEATPGGTMGDIYGRGYLRAPDGQIIYENGYPVLTNDIMYLGRAVPKWKGSIGQEFRYKQFRLNILFDGSFGAKAYSLTHATLAEQGKTKNTLPGRYNGIIGNGVIQNGDGSFRPNDVVAENIWTYYTAHFGRDNVEGNLFSTDFIKLREVRLDYTLPTSFISKLKLEKASIGIYGRNLWIISDWPAFDPEFGTLNNGTIDAGYELGQFPSTMTTGVNLNISF